MQGSHTLKAVHDDDLDEVLKSLEVYGAFTNGRLRCAFCQDVIGYENLHSLFPDSGAVKCCCSKAECIKRLVTHVNERSAGGRPT